MIELNKGQVRAVRFIEQFLRGPDAMMCLAGFSGSGKSTVLNHLVSELEHTNEKNNLAAQGYTSFDEVLLTATTAKAAGLLSGAKTIHKQLGLYVWKDFSTGKSNLKSRNMVLPSNVVVVVDEASMIDPQLLKYVKDHIQNAQNVKYIFVGDRAQLKSVGSKFSIFEQNLHTYELTEPMRQDPNSSLYKACTQLRKAVFGESIKVPTGPDIRKGTKEELLDILNGDLSSFKCITYKNETAITFNRNLRKLHNRSVEWAVGDWVVVRSFYEPDPIPLETSLCIARISTGSKIEGVDVLSLRFSCGRYTHVAVNPDDVKFAIKQAKKDRDWNSVKRLEEHIMDIRDAGAGTIFTAQGSTYDTVFVDVADINSCRDADVRNRMLYTAVSRARKQVFLI